MKAPRIELMPADFWRGAGVSRARRVLLALALVLMPALALALVLLPEHRVRKDAEPVALAPAAEDELTPEQAAQAEALAAQLDYAWDDAFESLEQLPASVALLSLEHGALRRSARLVVSAADSAVVYAALERLGRDPRIASVQIVRQEAPAVRSDGETGRRRYQLELKWRHAPEEEATR